MTCKTFRLVVLSIAQRARMRATSQQRNSLAPCVARQAHSRFVASCAIKCRPRPFCASFLIASCGAALCAASDWQKNDPAQWTSNDVYQILNNAPWSKTVKTTVTNAKDPAGLSDQGPTGTTPPPPNTGQMPGTGRRGYGGGAYGSSSRTYSSGRTGGSGQSNTTSSSGQGPTEVTIQSQSALPVQIAAAKKVDENAGLSAIKPLDNYVVAVIGLPIRAIGGRAASVDSDQTTDEEETKNLENRLKSSTQLLRSGHEALTPIKVELNQGADGRILLYFSKADPITAGEKTVEFRLISGHTEIRKKFALKDMEYHGKLELFSSSHREWPPGHITDLHRASASPSISRRCTPCALH